MRLTAWTGIDLKEEMLESAILQLRAGAIITALTNIENDKLVVSSIQVLNDNEGVDIHIGELLHRVNGDNLVRDLLILSGNWSKPDCKFIGWNILDTRTGNVIFEANDYITPHSLKDIVFEYLYEHYSQETRH